jgi:arylsulfatase A-like enzyme
MRPPNIVIILCDDLGWGDCSCYGQRHWTTPHIDRLAADGLRLTDFYSTSPVCSPARASILTGLHAGRLPIRTLADPYLPDAIPTLPWLLKQRSYVSACIGKYGVGNGQPDVDPLRKGFDWHFGYNCMKHAHNYFPPFLRENGLRLPLRNRPPEGDTVQWETGVGVAAVKLDYSPDCIEARALEFIRDCQDRPFFLHYCPTLPHANNEGGDTPDGMEVDGYGEFADLDWPANEKGFARMVQRIDQTVGRVRALLEELGIAEHTLVLFTSDNGPHNEGGHSVTRFDSTGGLQGYKRSLHEGGIRVPGIAWWPGTIRPGVSAHRAWFPDLLPTCCALAGVAAPACDGHPLVPLLTGSGPQLKHPCLYFEFERQTAVIDGRWKYFRNDPALSDPASTGEGEALYDLERDPHEDHDLKTAHPDVLQRLKAMALAAHRPPVLAPLPPSYDPGQGRGQNQVHYGLSR